MFLKKLFKTSIFISMLVLVTLLVYTIATGYDNSISAAIKYFKYEKYQEQIKLLVTKNKFENIQAGIFIFILLLIIILKFSNTILNNIFYYLKDLRSSLVKCLNFLSYKHSIAILLLPILTIFYYAVNIPISYDEAWTYLNFSSKNIIISLTYYPAPNNHILHSVLTNFTNLIFPNFQLFSLRILNVVISLITFLLGMYAIKKHYNQNTSIASFGIFSILFMSIYYGYMSRGYALIMFFFIVSFHFVLNLIKSPTKVRDWVWLTVLSILGFFTMPSYLYAYVTLNGVLLYFNFKKNQFFINQIKFTVITIVATTILYFPIIMVNGLDSLTNNIFVAPKSREVVFSKLPEFLFQAIEDITGINAIFLLSIIIISLLMLLRNKDWFHIKIFTFFLIMPPFLLLAHSVIPFSRTFNYYGFIIVLLFCISIHRFLEKIKMNVLIISIICLQILFIFNFNNKIYNYEKYSIVAKEANSKIISENKSYLVSSELFYTYLVYSLKVEKTTNYALDYSSALHMSADTITKYNYIIIDRNIDETLNKKPIYSNDFFSVYE